MTWAMSAIVPCLMGAIEYAERERARIRACEFQQNMARAYSEMQRYKPRPVLSNCPNCGAPHEPVCSYCGTKP